MASIVVPPSLLGALHFSRGYLHFSHAVSLQQRIFSTAVRRLSYSVTKTTAIADEFLAETKGGSTVARVVLKKGKGTIFRHGCPLVYSGAIDRVVGRPPPDTGDLVWVEDGAQRPIGWGVFNPVSMYRVRIMQTEEEVQRSGNGHMDLKELLATRVREAVELRRSLGLPRESETDVFRLINSEGDRLSGVIADVLGCHVVVASSAAWAERYRGDIIEAIMKAMPSCSSLSWRPSRDMLREEGIEIKDSPSPSTASEEDSSTSPAEEVQVVENGVRYWASLNGQKTGFYADQRESRKVLAEFCQGRRVLDLCCYSGAFAINAALAGASSVIGVDSSGPAVQLAARNAALNGLDPDRCHFLQADVMDFMKDAHSRGQTWDVVILDPPKLAPSRKVLQRALARYRRLNSLAMNLVTPGGLLMSCSCSGAVTQSSVFPSMLQEAAAVSGRRIRVVRKAQAGLDHPIDLSYPEGEYLSNYLLHVT